MTPAGLPWTIPGLRQLIDSDQVAVADAIRLQRQAVPRFDAYHCVVHAFGQTQTVPDKRLPLAGVGLAHKDIFYMGGRAPGCGTGLAARRSACQAKVLRHQLANGATLLAALSMAEHASGVTGENSNLPLPVNPIDEQAAVGGSSSGSAVAVAAGLCYGSLGTDTAGSVRIPAASCGIVGFKPSKDALSAVGVEPLAKSLDCVGILARNTVDAAMVFQYSLSPLRSQAVFGTHTAPAALSRAASLTAQSRISFCLAHVDERVCTRPDIRQAIERFAGLTGKTRLRTGLPHFAELIRNAELILNVEASSVHLRHLDSTRRPVGKFTRKLALTGAAIPGGWYVNAMNERKRLTAAFVRRVFADTDFLVLPVLAQGVPDWAAVHTQSTLFNSRALLDLFAWTSFVNYLGLPAITLPIGMDEFDRPISVQILAKPGDDFNLLAFAALAASTPA